VRRPDRKRNRGYAFNPTMPRYNADNFDTYYQIQLAVRYNF
jgi:hypothetical protein